MIGLRRLHVGFGASARLAGATRPRACMVAVVLTIVGAANWSPARAQENYLTWSYETTLYLNTTGSGAGVTETVVDFPVLVRLEPGAGKFEGFGLAKPDGADIRFANERGDHLPYEIERWVKDTIAEIWVLVDTVYGGDTTTIKMYFGNPNAADASRSDLVFDTANGFVGVYHLSDDLTGGSTIRDATGYGNHGTVVGTMTSASMVTGQVGRGLDFEHDSAHYIHLANEHNFDMTTALTISAWVRVESWPGSYGALVAKRDDSFRFHQSSKNPRVSLRCDGPSPNSSGTVDITPGVMYHLVGRYADGVGISIWHDGLIVGQQFATGSISTNDYNVTIGNNTVEDSVRVWDGLIDEVRISKVPRSDAWIRLCHQNQKAPQSLVSFGPTGLLGAYAVTIGVDSAGWGTTSPPNQFRTDMGDTITVTATPEAGYQFVRWERVSAAGTVQILSPTAPTTGVVLTAEADAAIKAVFGCSPVSITTHPQSATLGTGQVVTLSVEAQVCPHRTPRYQWYHEGAAVDDPAYREATLTIQQATKADSGEYYCEVSDQSGTGAVSSNTAVINVLSSPTITQPPQDASVVKGGTAEFSVTATGDGALSYQWYENGTAVPTGTGSVLSVGPVDLGANGRTYYCVVSNAVGTATTRTVTLSVSELPNPFRFQLWRPDIHDVAHVSVKIWSQQDLSTFPYEATFPPTPYADTLILAYRTGSPPTSLGEPDVRLVHFLVADVAAAPEDTLVTQIEVPPLSADVDSFYRFSYSLRWHEPDTTLPLITWGPVFMLDTAAPPNELVVWGSYDAATGRSDTAIVHIDSLAKLDSLTGNIRLLCGWANDTSAPMILDTTLAAGPLRGQSSTTLPLVNTDFPGELDTVYCWWYLVGTNGVAGTISDTAFTVGWPRPVYAGALRVDSIGQADKLILRWDAPGEVDSVKIWVDKGAPIPNEHAISLPPEQASVYDRGVLSDTVTGLSANTRYHFGLQVYRDGLWSVVTDAARDSGTTSDWCGDTVTNVVRVDTAWFDDSTNELVVDWTLTAPPVSGTFFEIGHSYGLDSAGVVVDTPVTFRPTEGSMAGTVRIAVRKGTGAIVADTNYHVGFWLRGNKAVDQCVGPPAYPQGEAFRTVRVPPLKWEPVNYFATDTVCAFNCRVKLVKPSDYGAAVTPDTLEIRDAMAGNGLLPAGIAFEFRKGDPTMPFLVGLKYDSLPGGVDASDLRVYRDTGGVILVEHGSYHDGGYVWVKTNDLRWPFMVMADTAGPRVEFISPEDTADALLANTLAPYEFIISDNVANVRWRFASAPGNHWYGSAELETVEGYRDTVFRMVDPDSVSGFYGLRAAIVVSDGAHTDTINASRRVRTTQLKEFVTPAAIWAPFRVRGTLDKPAFETVCDELSPGDDFKYDNSKFRAFRWMPAEPDSAVFGRWLEYASENADEFRVVPGRVIWVKTKARTTIFPGGGLTSSLRGPAEIRLAPNNWTDFALPYQFEVLLKDILAFTVDSAAGILPDSFEVINWARDGLDTVYTPKDVYAPLLPRLAAARDTAVLKSEDLSDAYSIFNPYETEVTLRIPPIPAKASIRAGGRLKTRSVPPPGGWDVAVRSHLSGGAPLNEVVCGVAEGVGKRRYLPLRPSMRRAGVGVRDEAGVRLWGHAAAPGLAEGGVRFSLVYYNDETYPVTVTSRLDGMEGLPTGLRAGVFVPARETFEPDASAFTVTLAPGGRAERHLLVGTSAYLRRYDAVFVAPKLALLATGPNPFRGRLTVRYSLPYEQLEYVRFTLYDMRGRRVWRAERREGLRPGSGSITWDGREHLPSGLYVLRMGAKEARSGRVKSFETVVTCVR